MKTIKEMTDNVMVKVTSQTCVIPCHLFCSPNEWWWSYTFPFIETPRIVATLSKYVLKIRH